VPICIYCKDSIGPFTREHVFPYSLGGGEWILQDLVCEDCNNLFSSLEREFARKSIEGMQRTAFGPEGRDIAPSGRRVPLYASGIFYLPNDSNLVLEGGLELGFKPIPVQNNFF
jgi:hypothetical protein